MKNSKVALVVALYGSALLFLGFIGYRSGSHISGYLGAGFGLAMATCSPFIAAGKKSALYIALSLALILASVFAARYTITKKESVAAMAVLGFAMFLFLLVKLLKRES